MTSVESAMQCRGLKSLLDVGQGTDAVDSDGVTHTERLLVMQLNAKPACGPTRRFIYSSLRMEYGV